MVKNYLYVYRCSIDKRFCLVNHITSAMFEICVTTEESDGNKIFTAVTHVVFKFFFFIKTRVNDGQDELCGLYTNSTKLILTRYGFETRVLLL